MLLLKSFTSDDRSIVPPSRDSYLSRQACLYFHYAPGFATQILAYMLDSLVRVSRRVDENHFVRIAMAQSPGPPSTAPLRQHSIASQPRSTAGAGRDAASSAPLTRSSIQTTVQPRSYNRWDIATPPYLLPGPLLRAESILTHQSPLNHPPSSEHTHPGKPMEMHTRQGRTANMTTGKRLVSSASLLAISSTF